MITRSKIERVAADNGWNCRIERKEKWEVEFQRYTNVGQDVSFSFEVDKLSDLPYEVYECWQNYDPDYETMLWIGADGHGKNGAPYAIEDINADMKDVENDLEWLQSELNKLS